MKKLLLLMAVVLSSSAIAQTACGTPTTLTASGTYVCPAITGTYPTGSGANAPCYTAPTAAQQPAGAKAIWYKFTPAQSGIISVTSAIAANSVTTTDTRLHVYSGSCVLRTCVAGNDDVNEAAEDYRSAVNNVIVNAGTTYYIVWDNRWATTGFSFQFTYTPQTCFTPTGYTYTAAPTTTSVGIGWTAPATGTVTGYQYEYGPAGFTQGTGTTVDVTTPSATIGGLTASTVYDFYIRTKCVGTDYSIWAGPISFNTIFEAATPPYNTGFEQDNFDFIGWTTELPAGSSTTDQDWQVYPAGVGSTLVQEGANMALIFSNATADGATDAWMLSRPIAVQAGSTVNLSFYARNYLGTGSTGSASFEVKAGMSQDIAGMTIPVAATTSLTNTTYELKQYSFTASAAGEYFIGFHANSPANAGTNALFIDNVTVTETLGVGESNATKFAVYPNPANSVIKISNPNATISSVKINDINGRLVKTINVVSSTEIQLNISDLANGVYMMDITSDKGTEVKKFVKK